MSELFLQLDESPQINLLKAVNPSLWEWCAKHMDTKETMSRRPKPPLTETSKEMETLGAQRAPKTQLTGKSRLKREEVRGALEGKSFDALAQLTRARHGPA